MRVKDVPAKRPGIGGRVSPVLRTAGDVNIIDIGGRMTLGSRETDGMGDIVRDLLHNGKKKIVLNLEKVTYIDSASLGVLVAHYKRAAEKEALLKLLKPNQKTLSILVMTKLNLVFEIFEDEAQAVASF
jgi:anti-anti-sigma factor